MTSDHPPYDDTQDTRAFERRGVSVLGIIAIGGFAVLSFYAALIVFTRLDHIVLPGNELGLGGVPGLVPFAEAPPDQEVAETIEQRINILFLGLDRRIDDPEGEPYRTDSIMVLTIDPFSKTAGAFSIPRDTMVEYLDADGAYYTEARINQAWEFGEYPYETSVPGLADYPGGGAGLAKDTVEHNFGIPVDYYVLMDWIDFMDIVEELGGLDINVPAYAYDPAYTACSRCNDVYPLEFLPGPETMGPERALAYARIRASDDDFKRIERQQLVLKAMARKASSIETILDNPIGLYNQFKDAIETDIPDLRAPGLALLASQVGVDNIRTVSMAPATYDCSDDCPGGARVLFFHQEKMEELRAQVFNDSRIGAENAVFEVLNGTLIGELAATFGTFLRTEGIPSTNIIVDEFADDQLYDTSFVIDRTGTNQETIAQLSEWLFLPEGRVLTADDPQAAPFLDTTASLIVVLGQDIEVLDWSTGEMAVADPLVAGG